MVGRIAILGVGAVGSYLGAFLTREGHDVTLIDTWGEHVETMRTDGLRVSGTQGDFTVPVQALHLSDGQAVRDPFDVAFISVKSYETEWAAHYVKGMVSATGVVVSAQNCMNDVLIASIVGVSRHVGLVLSAIGVALWEPGHVSRGGQPGRERGHDVFRVGELHGGITSRVEELAEILDCIDSSRVTSNIWGERWSKLTTNASTNPVGAMAGLGSGGMGELPAARLLQVHISKESVQVGLASGYDIEPVRGVEAEVWADADKGDVFEELDSRLRDGAGTSQWKASMGQDVTKGRHTEIDQMNGHIVRVGEELGVPTPVNSAVVAMVRSIDSGDTRPDPGNVQRVLDEAGLSR